MSRNHSKSLGTAVRGGAEIGQSLLELVLPPTCRFCNEPIGSGDFCDPCESALSASTSAMQSVCLACGMPKPVLAGPGVTTKNCVHCRRSDFEFDRVIPLWSYQDRVCEAVVAAKYGHATPLGDALGRRLGRRVQAEWDENEIDSEKSGDELKDSEPEFEKSDMPDLVTFVPSHLSRRFARGGTGNAAIASAVGGVIGRPCRGLLRSTRRIAKQAWLSDQERQQNVRGAFSLKKSYAFRRSGGVKGRHILLVDDVLTTGATANEVSRVLRVGGARWVTLAVVARALRC